jgi:hypothetical protein
MERYMSRQIHNAGHRFVSAVAKPVEVTIETPWKKPWRKDVPRLS